jgi:7-carboxy-7-deazaguanine synthase (Cx14CxxC type)
MYTVKELFPTLQGEGAHTGRAAIFCRFAGCNLWSGREEDRASAVCQFCDTDFIGSDGHGGGKFEQAVDLANAIELAWNSTLAGPQQRYVVFTGGEPLLQLDAPLIDALHQKGFEVAIETNGTIKIPKGVDWVCVSPKAGSELVVLQADEIKLVIPQVNHHALESLLARF